MAFGYGPKCQGWLQQLNHKGNRGAASASRSWYCFCQNGHSLQDWLTAPRMHSNCTMKLSNIQISRFKKTQIDRLADRYAWFHQLCDSRRKEGGMGTGKILSLISNMSLVITKTKASLFEGAQRIQLFCVVWQFHATGTKSPTRMSQRTWKRETLCPLRFDYSKWNEIKEGENRGLRLTSSSKPMKIKKNCL